MSATDNNPNDNPVNQNQRSEARQPSENVVGLPRHRRRARRPLNELTPSSIVDIKEVSELTSLSRATIYRKMKAGTFPSNRQLNANRAGWRLADVQAWLDNLR